MLKVLNAKIFEIMIAAACLLLAVLILAQNYFVQPVTERISPLVFVLLLFKFLNMAAGVFEK